MTCNGNFGYMFIIICMLCMLYHISSISNKYFKYDTNTLLEVKQPRRIDPPSFTLCVKYLDISDIKNLSTTVFGRADEEVYATNVTIKQIFEHTPSTDEVFSSCLLSYPHTLTLKRFKGNDCLNVFRVEILYTRLHIVARLRLASDLSVTAHALTALYKRCATSSHNQFSARLLTC